MQNPISVDRRLPILSGEIVSLASLSVLRRLPIYVILPVCLTVTLFLLMLTIHTIAGLFASPGVIDAFSLYESLMPGQSTTAVAAFDCHDSHASYNFPEQGGVLCFILSQDDAIQSVTIYARNHTITGLAFAMKNMQVIHLVSHWGRPDQIDQLRGGHRLRWWKRELAVVTQIRGRYSLLSPVKYIYIADTSAKD